MPTTRPLARALLFTLALATHPPARGPTGTLRTASPPASQRAAAPPAALTAAHTALTDTSGRGSGPFPAHLALLHGAPHTHATAPAQPERDHGPMPPDITHAARAHNRPPHQSLLAGHTQLTQAHAHTTRPHGATRPRQPRTHISVQPILTRATARSNDQNNRVAPSNSSDSDTRSRQTAHRHTHGSSLIPNFRTDSAFGPANEYVPTANARKNKKMHDTSTNTHKKSVNIIVTECQHMCTDTEHPRATQMMDEEDNQIVPT